jgi:exonuclease III
MKIISWNIRGLNGCSKHKLLRDLILVEKPDIVLLQEKKCTSEDVDRLLPYCWKQGEAVSTTATGTAGGLAILWNTNSVLLEKFIATRWSITVDYRLIGSNKPGHLANVYGPTSLREKQDFLRNMNYLSNLMQHNRWIIGGDFNIICSLEEKKADQDGWIEKLVTSTAS